MIEEIQFCGSVDEATSLPGAYVIAIELAETVMVTLGGRSAIDLPTGRYLYCGSAKGPGGLKARLSRHFRRGKSVRSHIYQLTERGSVVGCWILPGGDECELVRRFLPLPIRLRDLAAAIARHAAAICCSGRKGRHCHCPALIYARGCPLPVPQKPRSNTAAEWRVICRNDRCARS